MPDERQGDRADDSESPDHQEVLLQRQLKRNDLAD